MGKGRENNFWPPEKINWKDVSTKTFLRVTICRVSISETNMM